MKRTGPSLPEGLLGGCAASLNAREIIVMGGYSPISDDFRREALVLDTLTEKWVQKIWATLENGPRLDLSCASVFWQGEQRVLVAGGWNNSATTSTEVIDQGRFQVVTKKLGDNVYQPLPKQIRSATMVDLGRPIMAGGVICTG